MKRFYDNDDDEFIYGEEDEIISENDEAIKMMLDNQDAINVLNLDLAQTELNQLLLDKAIKIAKCNFFWIFKNSKKKTEEIIKIYKKLSEIID